MSRFLILLCYLYSLSPVLADIGAGLNGHWTMDNHLDGPTIALNGTGVQATFRNGKIGSTLELKGDGFVTVANDSAFQFGTGSFTVATWIYVRPEVTIGTLMSTLDGGLASAGPGWQIQLQGNSDGWTLNGSGVSDGMDTASCTPCGAVYDYYRWYHVAMVYDAAAGTLSLYVDAELDAALSVTTLGSTDNTRPLVMGAVIDGAGNADQYYNGLMDEVRIYNRAVDAGDLQILARGGHMERIIDQRGPLPINTQFFSNGGPATFIASGSGYTDGANNVNIGMSILIDGVERGRAHTHTNFNTGHTTWVSDPIVVDDLTPGVHDVSLVYVAGWHTVSDTSNPYRLTMIQLPLPGSEPYDETDGWQEGTGMIDADTIPYWNGSALLTGSVQDSGQGRIGVGTAPHTAYAANVNGTLNATALKVDGVDVLTGYIETDPQVDSTTLDRIPTWNGAKLIDGSIQDSGQGSIGVGTAPHATYAADVNGTLNATALKVDGVDVLTGYIETDPQVDSTTLDRIPTWNGAKLIDGSIQDSGQGSIGVGTAPHATYAADVNGTLNATALKVDGVDVLTGYIETDPQVDSTTIDRIPTWNGAKLIDGSIQDSGQGSIGVGTAPHATYAADVNGTLNATALKVDGVDVLTGYIETDPQVDSTTIDRIPTWNGAKLIDGSIQDSGQGSIGVGTAPHATYTADVNGTLNATNLKANGADVLTTENLITQNVTLTVSPSMPGAYATIVAALDALATRRIGAGVIVTIEVIEVVLYDHPTIVFNHPDGKRIHILGNVPDIGQDDQDRARIMFQADNHGLQVLGGSHVGKLDNVVLAGVTGNKNGVMSYYQSYVHCGPNVIVEGFATGFVASYGGHIYAVGTTARNNTNMGYSSAFGAMIHAEDALAEDNAGIGFKASANGSLIAHDSTARTLVTGQNVGYETGTAGMIHAVGSTAENNTSVGYLARQASLINANNTTVSGSVISYRTYDTATVIHN